MGKLEDLEMEKYKHLEKEIGKIDAEIGRREEIDRKRKQAVETGNLKKDRKELQKEYDKTKQNLMKMGVIEKPRRARVYGDPLVELE